MKVFTRLLFLGVALLNCHLNASGAITGQWGFKDSDLFLSAQIGLPMDFLDLDTDQATQFDTTTNFGIAPIAGSNVVVMRFPKTGPTGGYSIPHGAAPNGGSSSSVNQYTIIIDVLFPASSSTNRRALFQTTTPGNAEIFITAANAFTIDGGLIGGSVTPDVWHRLAISADVAAATPILALFVDGVKVAEGNPGSGLDGRFSVTSLELVNDDDGETDVGYVSSIQFRDEKIDDALILALGAPTPDGILTGPPPNPYVSFVTPPTSSTIIPERSTVSPRPLIEAKLKDGASTVDETTVTMLLDNALVPSTTTRDGETTTVSFTPTNLLGSLSLHTVRINYKDNNGASYSSQWQFSVGRYTGLAASGAQPPGSGNTPGFVVRSVQAPVDAGILNPNTLSRAIHQLNGTLTDTGGVLVANVAIPGGNTDGSYDVDVINFHLDGTTYGVVTGDAPFPGIPGSDGGLNNFATEVLTYLEVPAGVTRIGVSVSTDRTDTETDDGYALFSGVDARNFLAPVIGSFDRGNVPGFAASFTTNQFTLVAPVDGVYPVRLVFYQTRNDASLEFYTIDDATGDRILVNNAADARAIKAFRESTAATANKPYVAEINPSPGAAGVSAQLPIQILLLDDQSHVNPASIQLSFNGALVAPTIATAGGRTIITYQPNATRADATNRLNLVYSDDSTPKAVSFTNDWQFTIAVNATGANNVTGQWDFDLCDLSATIGKPLQYFDGPNGQTKAKTVFGTCSSLGVPLINGEDAKIMQVPGDTGDGSRNLAYIMDHGIKPNGGGTRVNQYTIIWDVMVSDTGAGAASMLQITDPDVNQTDGDLFWQGNNFGQGGNGYNGTGAFTPKAWHRVIAAYDEAANPPVVTKYVDGIKQDDWTDNQGLDNNRRALLPTALLFADGDQDERRMWWVNSVQIRDGKLTDAEMAALGGPSASKIPAVIPETTVTGQWDFEQQNLNATIGKALRYFDGDAGQTKAKTVFGTCSALGVPLINGVDANIMQVPGDTGDGSRNLAYIMDHGIKPNGGGTRVNQYTIIWDVMISDTGAGAASMLQITDPDVNQTDGDLFWQGNNFGQGGNGYNGTGAFTPKVWHRVIAAYDEAANPPVVTKFVDGIKQDDWTDNQGLDNNRRALLPTALLFADGDQDERRMWWVNSIQIRDGKLSDAEMVSLGGPSASGIPVAVPKSNVTGQWDFDQQNLNATVGKALRYFDGDAGQTKAKTVFGTCSSLGVALVDGVDANIMQVPGDTGDGSRNLAYIMDHGIKPNGGGTRVNQYTIIWDVMISDAGAGAASMLQITDPDVNQTDGDLFWQGNNFGQGGNGYNGTGAFTPKAWHRVIAAYDEAANPPVVTKFVDGIFQDDWTDNQGLDNNRRALLPTALLFADGDQDERRMWWVNSIQIRSGVLSKAEMTALGGPSSNGIPVNIVIPAGDQAPRLSIRQNGATIQIAWAGGAIGYTLESTPSLTTPNWQPVAGVVANCASVPTAATPRFFRLRK